MHKFAHSFVILTINKEQIMDFKKLIFMENKENIIFVGIPDIGKTHLASV